MHNSPLAEDGKVTPAPALRFTLYFHLTSTQYGRLTASSVSRMSARGGPMHPCVLL